MLLVLWRIKEYLIISSIMYKCTIIKQSVIWEIIIPTSAVGRNVFNHFQWYHSTEVFDNYIINQLWTINACKQNLQVWGLLSAKSIWIIPSCSSMFCKFFLISWRSMLRHASVISEIIPLYLWPRKVDNDYYLIHNLLSRSGCIDRKKCLWEIRAALWYNPLICFLGNYISSLSVWRLI